MRFCIIKWIENWKEPRTIFLVAQGYGNFLFQTPTYVMPKSKIVPLGPVPCFLPHVLQFAVHWQHVHVNQEERI